MIVDTPSVTVFNESRPSPIGHASLTGVTVTAARYTASYRLSIPDLTSPGGGAIAILDIPEAHFPHAGTYTCHSQESNVTFIAEVVVLGESTERMRKR